MKKKLSKLENSALEVSKKYLLDELIEPLLERLLSSSTDLKYYQVLSLRLAAVFNERLNGIVDFTSYVGEYFYADRYGDVLTLAELEKLLLSFSHKPSALELAESGINVVFSSNDVDIKESIHEQCLDVFKLNFDYSSHVIILAVLGQLNVGKKRSVKKNAEEINK